MRRWLGKHGVAVAGIFLTVLYIYLQLVIWKKHGDDLRLTAISITLTCFLWAILLIAIEMYYRRRKQFGSQLTEAVIRQIEQVGKLRSLAGRAEWLADYLEQTWHEFNKQKLNMPHPLAKNAIPDKIEAWTDKQLWSFRDKYRSYLGSLEAVDPDSVSDLAEFPCESDDYLALHRKMKAHVVHLQKRAEGLLAKVKEEGSEK